MVGWDLISEILFDDNTGENNILIQIGGSNYNYSKRKKFKFKNYVTVLK